MTLPAGEYIAVANFDWDIDIGTYMVGLTTSGSELAVVRTSGAWGGGTIAASIFELSTQSTINLVTYQSSGSEQTAKRIRFKAIRVV